MQTCVRYDRNDNGIVTLTLDLPGKSVNTLSRQMWNDLAAAVEKVESDTPRGVIVTSAKPKTFIAGADLFELRAMTDEQLHEYLLTGQQILERIERLDCPTVAAINGDALGGGLEVALACRHRVCADDAAIKLGLPEVTLGLVPGWGGTVRLTRLIGAQQAVPIASTGKPVSPADALKLGLVDAVAPREGLAAAAIELIRKSPKSRAFAGITQNDIEWLSSTEMDYTKKFGELNPAPLRIVQVIRAAAEGGSDAGYAAERRGLVELRSSPAGRNLLRLFFLRQSAKKDAAKVAGGTPREIKKVAVFGGGMMGGGIVHAFVKSKVPVVCIEAEAFASAAGVRIKSALEKDGLNPGAFVMSSDPNDILDSDLIIEAISEDLGAKEALFKMLDTTAKPQAILASNTSSLSIAKIAQTVSDASRVVGIHFFNPVPRMPLVEVVRQPSVSADAMATAVAIGTQLGKTPIVCNDAPGFIVNRILMPYLSESMRLAEEGVSIESIDSAVKKWGMPMGPFELLDQIGLDVIVGIFRALRPHLKDRVEIPPAVETALSKKWLGRKSKIGFYIYPEDRAAKSQVNAELIALLTKATSTMDAGAIQDRCLLPMANEAARVLEENVTDSIDAIDLACITGLGMAGWRGGICRYVIDTGVSCIVSKLQKLAAAHGDRLNPSEHLWKMAEAGR